MQHHGWALHVPHFRNIDNSLGINFKMTFFLSFITKQQKQQSAEVSYAQTSPLIIILFIGLPEIFIIDLTSHHA